MAGPRYTDKQKIAYYKKKASVAERSARKPSYKKRYNRSNRSGNSLGYSLGSAVGGMIPGAPGITQRVGGAIGSGLQALVTGQGDYTVSRNSLLYNSDAVPKFSNDKRCTIITHREFIKDIRSSVAFESSEFTVNPGDFKTFPWLSRIAQNYEEYIFQGILFEYKTNSATAVSSTNTALGTVCMASQYNTLAPSFTSKHQIENYEFANSSVPCESMLHAIECDPSLGNEVKSIFNERDSDLNADPRNYNLCRTTIATQGMQAASTIGELWVTYKVCLMKPRLGNNDNIADFYAMDAAGIGATRPISEDLIASSQNIGFTSQIKSGNYNHFEIDPTYQGILQVVISYGLTSFTSFECPRIEVVAGNASSVTQQYSTGPTTLKPDFVSGQDSQPNRAVNVGYFKVDGGYDSSGDKPTISIDTGSFNNCVFNGGTISFIAVPSQAVTPEYI
jgi:hypothetical protein